MPQALSFNLRSVSSETNADTETQTRATLPSKHAERMTHLCNELEQGMHSQLTGRNSLCEDSVGSLSAQISLQLLFTVQTSHCIYPGQICYNPGQDDDVALCLGKQTCNVPCEHPLTAVSLQSEIFLWSCGYYLCRQLWCCLYLCPAQTLAEPES